MKLVLSCPTYGPVEPIAERHLRVAMCHATEHAHVKWCGDASPNRMAWAAARNLAVKAALEAEDPPDAILWVDSDIILPQDAITRLVLEGKDFITGIYCQREPPHFPLIANYDKFKETFSWFIEAPDNVVAPIDGCGFGCVLTSTTMLKAMSPPWFAFTRFSEDFDFALKAAKAGFQLFVHTGVKCGHLREPVPATWDDFTRLRDSGQLATYLQGPPRDSAA
jgi:GT2 family glycosyltransferase